MRHLIIPDTQVRKGVPMEHLAACGQLIVDEKPDRVIMIGDWADMPSLSVYDRAGSKSFEGRRYKDDVVASKEAMDILFAPIREYNLNQRRNKRKLYRPDLHLTLGNHENRINRAIESNPNHLEGIISTDDLGYRNYGWKVHPFLKVVNLDGIAYSHYFVNPNSLTGTPVGGTVSTKLANLKQTFCMGHQQSLQYGHSYTADGTRISGLVAGSFYQHDEDYMGPQKNNQHWRGVVILDDVKDGEYDPQFISMKNLMRRYT